MKHQNETPLTERKVVRRGLLAGLAGLGAAAAMKLSGAGKAEAGHDAATAYVPAGVMHTGVVNDGGNILNDESATTITTRTTLVGNISGGANAVLRVRNLGSGGMAIEGFGADPGGDGLRGLGGDMFAAVGLDDGRGVVAVGGPATVNGVIGGTGVDATGGNSLTSTGGHGVVSQAGASNSGTGGMGVNAGGG